MAPDGLVDSALFAVGAAVLIAAVRWWRPQVPRRWAVGYALLVFALFAVPLVTSSVQVPVDIPYRWAPWSGALNELLAVQNPLLSDIPFQMLPFRTLVRERLLAGEAPLWANELGTGQPLLGDAQSAPFAPLHLMALPVPPMRGLTLAAAWQVLLGLLLTHALALALMGAPMRALMGGGPPEPARQLGAATAAVAFALSAYAVVWLYHPLSMVAMFVPGVLLGVLELSRGGRGAFAGLVACAVGMAVSGHPETVAHTAIVVAGVALVLLVRGPGPGLGLGRADRSRGSGRLLFLGRATAAALLALALSAPALLPVVETLGESQRVSYIRSGAAVAMHPPPLSANSLVPLVDPLAFGSPRDGDWHGWKNLNEACSHYAGLLTLALALAGAAIWRGRILAIVAGGALALAVALNLGPAFDAFNALPGMADASHGRLRLIWVLAAALAAGLTVAELARASRGQRLGTAAVIAGVLAVAALHPPALAGLPWRALWWGVALGGAVLVALGLSVSRAGAPPGPLGVRTAVLALVPLAILADLALFGARYHPIVPPEHQIPPPPSVAWLQKKFADSPQPFRVIAEGWGLAPNTAAYYGLWDPRSNDPMAPARPAWLLGPRLAPSSWRPGKPLQLRGLRGREAALALLGVRYVLTHRSRSVVPPWRLVFDGPGARVVELPDALPLFFVPERARAIGPDEDGYEAAERIEDFRRLAVYSGGVDALAGLAGAPGSSRPEGEQAGEVRLLGVGANHFELETRSDADMGGMIVASSVSDAPGWRLAIDDAPAEPLTVDWAFVGFRVPAGVHRVTLRYAPASWRWGLALFAIGLGGLGVLAVLGVRRMAIVAARRRAVRLIATAARRRAGSGAP